MHTNSAGLFGAKVKIWESACGYQLGFVEAWAAASTPYGDASIPLAIHPLPVGEAPATDPGPPVTGTGLAIITADRDLPWNDIVMLVIVLLAFTGGTVAIVRSSRRR